MISKRLSLFMVLLAVLVSLAQGEPTAQREWTSTAGTKITAKATGMAGGKVTLVTSKGKKLQVPLSKLSKEDRDFLKKHFGANAGAKPMASTDYERPKDLKLPLGEFSGPIRAANGSSYYIYLPSTMAEGIKPPVLFWTGAGVSDDKAVVRFKEAAEVTGVAVAVSVESKNQANAFAINHGHTKACLKHIKRTLPVDINRAIFTGGSGGGATAFYNADRLKCAAAMPYTGYVPDGSSINKKIFYYIGTGARDFNRYASAAAAKKIGNRGMHRLYTGGHATAREPEAVEGLIWLYTRHIYQNPKKFEREIEFFEARFLPWLQEKSKKHGGIGYFWTDHLINTCKIQGGFADQIQELHSELGEVEKNQRYLAGYKALARFAVDVFAPADKLKKKHHMDHITPEITAAAKVIEEEYQDVREISAIARQLGMSTAM